MGLLDQMLGGIVRVTGPLKCPRCGRKAGQPGGAGVVICGGCGWRGSVMEWGPATAADPVAGAADPDRPPPGTKVTRRELGGGGVAWEVPPSGKSGGLLFFAVFWNGFMILFTSLATGAMFKGGFDGAGPGWLGALFLIPFWAVGIGMACAALRIKFARHLVVVDPREVVLIRSMFGRIKRRALARDSLETIEKREFYQQNYQPVHGIELRGRTGKLRFGTALSEEEKDWLVADLRRTVWPGRAASAAATPPPVTTPARPANCLNDPRRSFTTELPPGRGAGQYLGAVVGLLIAGAFLTIGIVAMKDAGLFRHLWLGLNGLFALAIINSLAGAVRNAGVTLRVTGDHNEIRVQRMKGPRVLDEQRIPRPGLELRAFHSGRVNRTNMMRAELLGPHGVTPIVRWRPAGELEPFVRELREHLPERG
jgi:hypothetical protein